MPVLLVWLAMTAGADAIRTNHRLLPRMLLPGRSGLAAGQLCGASLQKSTMPSAQVGPCIWKCRQAWSRSERPFRASPPLMGETAGSKPTAVYALILLNLVSFVADKVLRMPFVRSLYLVHSRWAWWQPLTSCFCHADRAHLSGNLFLLLLFGRSVEDDLGWGGLLFSFAFCGIVANLISLLILPRMTVSIGASGAVFGLFAVSTLAKLSWADLDWRKLVEVAVLGEFVVGKVLSEIRVSATGGVAGINHVAHLSGAAAGAAMVLLMRAAVSKLEARDGK